MHSVVCIGVAAAGSAIGINPRRSVVGGGVLGIDFTVVVIVVLANNDTAVHGEGTAVPIQAAAAAAGVRGGSIALYNCIVVHGERVAKQIHAAANVTFIILYDRIAAHGAGAIAANIHASAAADIALYDRIAIHLEGTARAVNHHAAACIGCDVVLYNRAVAHGEGTLIHQHAAAEVAGIVLYDRIAAHDESAVDNFHAAAEFNGFIAVYLAAAHLEGSAVINTHAAAIVIANVSPISLIHIPRYFAAFHEELCVSADNGYERGVVVIDTGGDASALQLDVFQGNALACADVKQGAVVVIVQFEYAAAAGDCVYGYADGGGSEGGGAYAGDGNVAADVDEVALAVAAA